jgi:aminoglycoside phosphotransferase family enzyme
MTTQTGRKPDLISSLLSGEAFFQQARHPKLIETHISWVVLTEDFAYKIKKPVNLGFLDFSTLDLRKFFCEEELRLNRRTAPGLYLEVVPIASTADGFRVGVEPAVEYAVKMRRFPDGARLDQQLEHGKLDVDDFRTLASTVARFHDSLSPELPEDEKAFLQRVQDPVWSCFTHILPTLDSATDLAVLSQIKAWAQVQFKTLTPTFRLRARRGYVRECHGDLHLANLFRIDDRIIPFDCLEFNSDLRWIDQISDIAFLIMDLMANRRADLASAFLNSWLEHSGDYQGLEVLRFYMVYRSLVRAKVAAINVQSSADIYRGDSSRECRRYLLLALELVNHPRPCLLITHGFSGSGKSWLSGRLETALPAIRIRSDVERKRLFGLDPLARSGSGIDSGLYSADATERTYERLETCCATGLRAGFSMIADATFLEKRHRLRFLQMAAWLRARPVILDCTAPESVLRQRLQRRMAKKQIESEADIAVLQHQFDHHQALANEEQKLAVRMPSEKGPVIKALVKKIGRVRSVPQSGSPDRQSCPVS